MELNQSKQWLPEKTINYADQERRVGVELEFSGCEPVDIHNCITKLYGGKQERLSALKYQVNDTNLGDFIVELDAQILHKITAKSSELIDDSSILDQAEEWLKTTAEHWVPGEVVTPPIRISELERLNQLVHELRKQGALGTRHATRYAFGLHLNPELPSLEIETILSYLQAFLCLYDWIYQQEKVDVVRKVTPYIDHFNKDYILKVVDKDYRPTRDTFIQDYIEYNPTRNRSLDLLPLFAHIDKRWVKNLKEVNLIKARPTFHYRLPNCDIDNPNWDLSNPWSLWLKVEQLANNTDALELFSDKFRQDYQRVTRAIDNKWTDRCQELLDSLTSTQE